MPLLREIIATELETQQVQDRACFLSSNSMLQEITDTPHPRMILPDVSDYMSCSDSDFEDSQQMFFRSDRSRHALMEDKSIGRENSSKSVDLAKVIETEPVEWNDLHPSLKEFLPSEKGVTYVITELNQLPTEEFAGAPKYSYETTVRINLTDKEAVQSWMQKMMQHSKCTYRHTRGRTPGLKRVVYKAEMHCQHQRKALSSMQQQKALGAKSKNPKKVLTHDIRMKKTDCPSRLTITVLVPTKKDQRASEKKPYLVTHPTVLRVIFNHNHPIDSAHALSFRPISLETRNSFLELFRKGHTAASAHHWYETKLYLDGDEDQALLADRATNPTKSDVSRLYIEWQKKRAWR